MGLCICSFRHVWEVGPIRVEVHHTQISDRIVRYLIIYNKINGKTLPGVEIEHIPIHISIMKSMIVVILTHNVKNTRTIPLHALF